MWIGIIAGMVIATLAFALWGSLKAWGQSQITLPTITEVQPSPSPASVEPPAPVLASFANGDRITVPDSGRATPYPSDIVVSEAAGTLSKLTVEISGLSHDLMSDLNILLLGPDGRSVALVSDVNMNRDPSNINITFDDEAPVSLAFRGNNANSNISPVNSNTGSVSGSLGSGSYRPTSNKRDPICPSVPTTQVFNKLSIFNGINPNGRWRLYVYDDAGGDKGIISRGWRLTMTLDPTTQPPPQPQPSGSLPQNANR
jgi:subtilisin-like proprotein convertase family protein